MQYIAREILTFQGADGLMKTVGPGDDLPDFISWPYPLRVAHLDLGSVEEVGAQYTANLNYDQGYVTLGQKEPVVHDATFAGVGPEVVAVEVAEDVADAALAVASKGFDCTFCDRSFTRPSRLTAHIEKHH